MKVTWEVDDGYAGGSRPHVVEVDDDELAECETEEEREELINDYVQNKFEQNISWYIGYPLSYKNWLICYNPKPIPDFRFDWDAWHKDYDGPEDGRCFAASSIEEAQAQIDVWGKE